MATYTTCRAMVAEHAALRWRLTALQRCRAFLDRGEHAAALAAYQVAERDPLSDEPMRQAVDAFALMLATPAAVAVQ